MYLLKFEQTIQVTEDSFRVVWCEKLFNEFTTISEMIEWVKTKEKGPRLPVLIISKPEN